MRVPTHHGAETYTADTGDPTLRRPPEGASQRREGRDRFPTSRRERFLRRNRFVLVALAVMSGTGCDVLEGGKPVVPSDHTQSLDGALHPPGSEDPYLGGGNCTDYRCHHADLKGGWSMLDLPDGHRLQTYAPSCYQCHGVVWNVRYPVTIRVLYPDPNALWEHGSSRFIEWWAPTSSLHIIELMRDGSIVTEIVETRAPGVVRIESIPASWGSGGGFRIRIRDEEGRSSVSPLFSICEAGAGISVTHPLAGSAFERGGTIEALWSCAAGVSVDILVFQDGKPLDVFKDSAANTGFASRPIPMRWGTGTGYRLMIRDGEERTGLSGEFEIR